MRGSRAARRYARALLELAGRGRGEDWGTELARLARAVEAPELMVPLTSPGLSAEVRRQAMEKIAERLGLSAPLRSFAVVVARHGRVREFGAIAEAYQALLDGLLGRARATLTFAAEPGPAAVERVVAGLRTIAGKTIIPTIRVDRALLGGVVAELGGRIYDGSLAARLMQAERRLAG